MPVTPKLAVSAILLQLLRNGFMETAARTLRKTDIPWSRLVSGKITANSTPPSRAIQSVPRRKHFRVRARTVAARRLPQGGVSVVDTLEMVYVTHRNRNGMAIARRPRDFPRIVTCEDPAVGDTGELVNRGEAGAFDERGAKCGSRSADRRSPARCAAVKRACRSTADALASRHSSARARNAASISDPRIPVIRMICTSRAVPRS